MAGEQTSGRGGIVVIGGGIVGVSTALHLQRSGHQVTLIERDSPGSGASGHNGGVFNVGECMPTGTPGVLRSIPRLLVDPNAALIVRYRYLPQLSPWLVRFVRSTRSERVEEIAAAMQQLTDRSIDGYRPLVEHSPAAELMHEGGLLLGYRTEQTFDAARYGRELRVRHGVEFDVLDDVEITVLDPVLAGRFDRAIYRRQPHFTDDSQRFVELLADDFVARGGLVRHAVAQGIDARNGRVKAVVTTDGRVPAEVVVIAAGAWSRRLVRQLGFDVPLETERGYGVFLPDPEVELRLPVILEDLHIGITPTRAGLQLTGIDELASADAPPRSAVAKRVIRAATTVFPELRTEGAVSWMHCRPSLPDSLPVIGEVPGHRNAFMAFGHGHKGLGMGGITGSLIRQLVDGERPSLDLEPYSPLRFSRQGRRQVARDSVTVV